MKQTRKIIYLIFMAIAILGMFLPIATFHDNSAASLSVDIEKQQGKVDSAQTQLDRWIAGGKKSEAEIQKQRDKVAKEQAKLDALLAEQEAASGEAAAGLTYSLLPGKLPAEMEVDTFIVNQYKLYDKWNMSNGSRISENWNFSPYYISVWAAFGCLVLAALLVVLAGKKDASKLYTISSFLHLIGIILAVYVVIRLTAIPVKLPYSSASLHTLTVIMLLCGSILAL